ncbi:MAG: type II secretion system protein [Desulfuromonas sp.]|nr:type II secretion system protein [Desulfuromonas sp.]
MRPRDAAGHARRAHSSAPLHGNRRTVGQNGTVLLTVLVLIVLLGLAATKASQSLGALMQREREAELLWRGQQYQQAIGSYYNVKHGAQQMFPAKLEDLLKDPRFPGAVRHLRRLYPDPMTGKEWEPVKDPAEKIIGVRSTSDLEPFQQAGFPKGLENLEGKTVYREWEFVFVPPKKAETPAQQGSRNKVQGNTTPAVPKR